jgi:hypothetical protein
MYLLYILLDIETYVATAAFIINPPLGTINKIFASTHLKNLNAIGLTLMGLLLLKEVVYS